MRSRRLEGIPDRSAVLSAHRRGTTQDGSGQPSPERPAPDPICGSRTAGIGSASPVSHARSQQHHGSVIPVGMRCGARLRAPAWPAPPPERSGSSSSRSAPASRSRCGGSGSPWTPRIPQPPPSPTSTPDCEGNLPSPTGLPLTPLRGTAAPQNRPGASQSPESPSTRLPLHVRKTPRSFGRGPTVRSRPGYRPQVATLVPCEKCGLALTDGAGRGLRRCPARGLRSPGDAQRRADGTQSSRPPPISRSPQTQLGWRVEPIPGSIAHAYLRLPV